MFHFMDVRVQLIYCCHYQQTFEIIIMEQVKDEGWKI